jgi:hypothetical protein
MKERWTQTEMTRLGRPEKMKRGKVYPDESAQLVGMPVHCSGPITVEETQAMLSEMNIGTRQTRVLRQYLKYRTGKAVLPSEAAIHKLGDNHVVKKLQFSYKEIGPLSC